jgi:hypothetical protein
MPTAAFAERAPEHPAGAGKPDEMTIISISHLPFDLATPELGDADPLPADAQEGRCAPLARGRDFDRTTHELGRHGGRRPCQPGRSSTP